MITERKELQVLANDWKSEGKTICMILIGVQIPHSGHSYLLMEAKKHYDKVVIVMARKIISDWTERTFALLKIPDVSGLSRMRKFCDIPFNSTSLIDFRTKDLEALADAYWVMDEPLGVVSQTNIDFIQDYFQNPMHFEEFASQVSPEEAELEKNISAQIALCNLEIMNLFYCDAEVRSIKDGMRALWVGETVKKSGRDMLITDVARSSNGLPVEGHLLYDQDGQNANEELTTKMIGLGRPRFLMSSLVTKEDLALELGLVISSLFKIERSSLLSDFMKVQVSSFIQAKIICSNGVATSDIWLYN